MSLPKLDVGIYELAFVLYWIVSILIINESELYIIDLWQLQNLFTYTNQTTYMIN